MDRIALLPRLLAKATINGGNMKGRVEICGAIAAGKTTLTNAFSKIGYNVELEDFTKISMLDDFYSNPLLVSFETEISFTMQHYYQIKKALQISEVVICDFSPIDDYAFALSILTEKEMEIYDQVFSYALKKIGNPQKLIKLDASTNELLSRIKSRGRQNEQGINRSSLIKFEENLSIAIERFYRDVPLIKINTEQYSFYGKEFLESL